MTHRLYTAANKFGAPATPGGRGAAVPDSFHVLVFAQGK